MESSPKYSTEKDYGALSKMIFNRYKVFQLCKLHLANVAVNCRRPLLNSVMLNV